MSSQWADVALFAVKLTAVLTAGALVFWTTSRRQAAVRNSLVAVTMLCAVAVPWIQSWAPQWRAVTLSAPKTVDVTAVEQAPISSGSTAVEGPPVAQAQADFGAWALGVWAVVASALALRTLVGLARVSRIPSTQAAPPLLEEARAASQTMGVRRAATVRTASIGVPMTLGLVRPVILVPESFATWPEDRRRTVLLHEAAHIARFDWVRTILANVFTAVYWCHPLAWLLKAALRDSAELAADERVVATGVSAADYAGHLLAIAQTCTRPKGLVQPLGVTIMSHNTLETRITHILGQRTRAVTRMGTFGLTLALALTAIVTAGASVQQQDPISDLPPGPPVAAAPQSEQAATVQVKKARAQVKMARIAARKARDQAGVARQRASRAAREARAQQARKRVRAGQPTTPALATVPAPPSLARVRQVEAPPVPVTAQPREPGVSIAVTPAPPAVARVRSAQAAPPVGIAVQAVPQTRSVTLAPARVRTGAAPQATTVVSSGARTGTVTVQPLRVRGVLAPQATTVTSSGVRRGTTTVQPARVHGVLAPRGVRGEIAIAGSAPALPLTRPRVVTAVSGPVEPGVAVVTRTAAPHRDRTSYTYESKTGVLTVTRNGASKTLKLGDPKSIDSVMIDAEDGTVLVKSGGKLVRHKIPD